MRIGLIARADRGGLANLTFEFAQHMNPSRVLLIDLMERSRGVFDAEKYAGMDVRIVQGLDTSRDDREWLISGSDVIYTAETGYGDELWDEARAAGVPTVLHVMPELYLPVRAADHVWLPTPWEAQRFPAAKIVPVPIATERFESKVRSPAHHFVHLSAPAMKDRNGTNTVLAALSHMKSDVKVTILGLDSSVKFDSPNVELVCPVGFSERAPGAIVAASVDNYWELFPHDADVLVLPRRFAGLSLPVQEAWARGMPAIMTDVSPQKWWRGVSLVRPHFGGREMVPMGSGMFEVMGCQARDLAKSVDNLANNDLYSSELSMDAIEMAESLSWERMKSVYLAEFEMVLNSTSSVR